MKESSVLIIAEAGVNHNGDIDQAIELIDVASKAGADVVKFQTFTAERLVTRSAKTASYQSQSIDDTDGTQYNMLKSLELSTSDHKVLIDACKKRRIQFLSTAFDEEGIDYLDSLNLPFFKSPSGEITNYPYLKRLAQKGRPVVLSTGMANMKEVKDAMDVLLTHGLTKKDITILHCNSEYPTPMEDVNLKAMNTIGKELGVQVGYSDHTMGIEVPIAVVALGAKVIEKHFTLDRNLPGPDHKASLEPSELGAMVSAIRNIEKAMSGNGEKEITLSERQNIHVVRKSIVAKTNIKQGEVFTDLNLTTKRPATGLNPMKWNDIIGKIATKDFQIDECIEIE